MLLGSANAMTSAWSYSGEAPRMIDRERVTALAPFLLWASLVVFALGCSGGPLLPGERERMRIVTDKSRYEVGESVQLTLTNLTHEELSYHFCSGARLERRVGSRWEPAEDLTRRICTLELPFLRPDQSATGRLTLRGDLTPGTYAYRFWIHRVDAPRLERATEQLSNSFTVVRSTE